MVTRPPMEIENENVLDANTAIVETVGHKV